LLTVLGPPSTAFAQVNRYAWPNGGGVPPCTNPFNPCPLLGDAIGASVAGDTIFLGTGTFLEHGLTIPAGLTINGAGVGLSIMDAQGQDRHFLVNAPGGLVTIQDMTLAGGAADPADAGGGGAVKVVAGTLEVVRTEISQSEGHQGGAISCYVGCAGLTVRDSSLISNASVLSGGAIFTLAETLVANSTLSGNATAGLGGAIYGWESAPLTVRDSQIAGNAADQGGGIARQFGSVKILRSALIGNSAASVGGGVFVYSNFGDELLVLNSTFSGNSAPDGGAIYQLGTIDASLGNLTMVDNVATVAGNADDITADGASITLSNSILTHPSGSANPECTGALATAMLGSDNLIDRNVSCVGVAGNFRRARIAVGVLGPLGFNGNGPTESYPVVPGGGGNRDPVDAVVGGCFNPRSGQALTQDQNLRTRPVGGPCTIGAVED
jgi:predicted outer membrane repeat protein